MNISGGQKARISLARAIYADSDIVLLDDPLSAVDPEVANRIFDECKTGALKDKIVILVTHQIQFLEKCECILLLKDGDVVKKGSYDEITETGFNIKDILDSYNQAMQSTDQEGNQFAKEVAPAAEAKQIEKAEKRPEPKKTQDLIAAEQKRETFVTAQDYLNILSYSPSTCLSIFLMTFLTVVVCLVQMVPNYIVSIWTKMSLEEQQESGEMLYLFNGFILGFLVLSIVRGMYFLSVIFHVSTNLHNKLVERVLRARILFYDSNPIGRIVTRFTKDQAMLDTMIAPFGVFVTQAILRSIIVVVVISGLNYYMIIIMIIGLIYMLTTAFRCIKPMVYTQQFDQQSYGPINSTFSMAVTGLITLRAYKKFDYFKIQFMQAIEKSANSTFCFNVLSRWIGLRLDLFSSYFSIGTVAFCVLMKGKIERELLTFSLQIVSDMLVTFSLGIRFYAELQNIMVAPKRIHEYTLLDIEDDLEKPGDQKLKDASWPSQGRIEFNNLSMRYRDDMEPSLRQLSCKIEPGMKVGIVGRTGAGKSTILQVLFRLTESCGGCIEIDGVDIAKIGLHMLRKNIAYIPQQPFLIQGTIRENLDPFNEFSEEAIVKILKEVALYDHIMKNCENGLQSVIAENNNLFSVGQKQLLCLGRAILRKTKILVLDEATANVDLETDNFIQEKLKQSFKGCTTLIIAHRLATVIDSDRIMVMSEGQCREFDHPFKLLTNDEADASITKTNPDGTNGFFAQMVLATGDETSKQLFEIAKSRYQPSN